MAGEYPECEKLQLAAPRSAEISQFLDWAQEQGIFLAHYHEDYYDGNRPLRVNATIEQLLANYFEIDRVKVEKERQEILASLR